MIERGQIWRAALSEPSGSEPGFTRPVLIVQADSFNRSRIRTVLAVALTTNLRLSKAPGNVLLGSESTGLRCDSVANISQIVTVDREFLMQHEGHIDNRAMAKVAQGLRVILDL